MSFNHACNMQRPPPPPHTHPVLQPVSQQKNCIASCGEIIYEVPSTFRDATCFTIFKRSFRTIKFPNKESHIEYVIYSQSGTAPNVF